MPGLAFVTGATGFVGRHLVEHLRASGWEVRALVRPTSDIRGLEAAGIDLIRGDLATPDPLVAGIEGCDAVFHLAAVTAARSEAEYERSNAAGTKALVDALARSVHRPGRLVYLSSYAAAGPSPNREPRSLALEPQPITAYGRTKLTGESLAREAEVSGVRVSIVRAPVVYGPADRALLPFFRLIRWRLAPVPGGSERRLHLIFAPDLATAMENAVEAAPGLYAVADPVPYLWEEVICEIATRLRTRPIRLRLPPRAVRAAAHVTETIGRLSGRAVAFNREKAEEMLADSWVCDVSGSNGLLRPERVTPLREGVERTTCWYIRQGWL